VVSTATKSNYETLLREHGLRATQQRIALLRELGVADRPLGIGELQERIHAGSMDTVTFYRILETLTEAGLVRKVNLRHGHMDYEFVREGEHHHHVACTKCGDVESFEWCPDTNLRASILRKTKRFSTINDHALEFFGVCDRCALP
jgi:Fe2+ or Zn2+ uptake regulation protein